MSNARSAARVRAEAARVIDAVVTGGRSLDAALESAADFDNPADRALLHYLSYGVLRMHWQLAAWSNVLLERPLRARDSVIQSLIAVGIYQLTDSRVPDHAAVSTTVEAARLLRRPKLAGLVNAVLRNFRRQDIHNLAPASDEIRYSHPAWLIDLLRQDWPADWQAILAANNERAPMWLRVNRLQHTTGDYLQLLGDAGIADAALLPGIDSAIRLAAPVAVTDLPGFASGAVSVQDAAAQLAGHWLGAARGERILDACAAPGGKAVHLLELAGGEASLTAIDPDLERLGRVQENLDRTGLAATLVQADASTPDAWWDGQPFDRILLDAPCSASGVIRRHPDIRLLRRSSDIVELAALQRRLLQALWPLLAPGGQLLYATCSVLGSENEAQTAGFLQTTADARENRVLPNNNIRDLMRERTCGYQILPGTRGLDGFYYACLKKG